MGSFKSIVPYGGGRQLIAYAPVPNTLERVRMFGCTCTRRCVSRQTPKTADCYDASISISTRGSCKLPYQWFVLINIYHWLSISSRNDIVYISFALIYFICYVTGITMNRCNKKYLLMIQISIYLISATCINKLFALYVVSSIYTDCILNGKLAAWTGRSGNFLFKIQ